MYGSAILCHHLYNINTLYIYIFRILVNYFLWRAIQAVLPYQPRNLQKAFWDTEAVLFGIKTEPPLWSSCVTATESVFPDVVGALYVDDYFNHEIRFKVLVVKFIQAI